MTPLLIYEQASEHASMDSKALKRMIKSGVGPAYVRISPRVIMFTRHDLDAWMATWTRREMTVSA